MIAPNENLPQALNFLSLGLNPQEADFLKRIASSYNAQVVHAHNEIDMYSRARSQSFDLFLMGQHDAIPDPSYLIWLLKGISNNSSFLLIYSKIIADEHERLDRFHAFNILQRPLTVEMFAQVIQDTLYTTQTHSSLWNSMRNLFRSKPNTATF